MVSQGLSEITANNHIRTVKKFIKNTGFSTPSPDSGIGYLAGFRGRGMSYSHIRNTTKGLWWYFRFWGMELKVRYPKKPKTEVQDTLTVAEIGKIISKCETSKEKAIIALLADTGIRTKELRRLKARDICLKRRKEMGTFSACREGAHLCKELTLSVVQGKNFTDREICITHECAKAIKTFLQKQDKRPEDYLFGEGLNKPLSLEYLRMLFRYLEKHAKINKRLHVYLFRHSLATNLLLNGADILTVQRQLGHKDPRTTLSYINYTDKLFRQQYQKYMPKYGK